MSDTNTMKTSMASRIRVPLISDLTHTHTQREREREREGV
jgi:hypothetical protein